MLPGEAQAKAEGWSPEAEAAARPEALVPIVVDGRSATVPRADLQSAIDAGATVDDGGALGSLKAAEVEFGSTVGAGLIPGAIYHGAKFFDPGWAEGWKENYEGAKREAEAHPWARMVGGGLGMGADLLGPMGKVAKGLGAIPGALGATGKAARVLGMGVEAAGLQSIYNAGKAASEDELGDVDSNAERLFHMGSAAFSSDVLLAGGLGLGLGAAGVGLGALKGRFLRAKPGPAGAAALDGVTGAPAGAGKPIAEGVRAGDEAVAALRREGMGGDQAAAHVDELHGAIGADLESGAATGHGIPPSVQGVIDRAPTPFARAKMQAYAESKTAGALTRREEVSALARDLKTPLDQMLEGEFALNEAHFTDRPGAMKAYADPAKFDAALDSVGRMTGKLDEVTRSLDALADKGGPGASGPLRDMQRMADRARQVMRGIEAPRTNAEAVDAISELYGIGNQMKKFADKAGKSGNLYGPWGGKYHEQQFRALADELRPMLEDTEAWGGIGEAQQKINKAFALDGRFESVKQFDQHFGTVLDTAGGYKRVQVDPAKVDGYLRAAGDQNATFTRDASLQALAEHVQNRVRVTRELGMADSPIYAKAEQAAKDVLAKVARAKDKAAAINAVDRDLEQAALQHGPGGHGMLGYAQKAIGLATNDYQKIDLLMQIEHGKATAAKAWDASVGRLMGAEKGAPKAPPPRPRADIVRDVEAAKAAQGDPGPVLARAQAAIGQDLQRAAPKHAAALAGVMARAVSFLAMQAPAGRGPSLQLLPSKDAELRYADLDLQRFERARDAVMHPDKVVADAAHGRLSREGVAALKYVYPATYQNLRGLVMARIQEMQRAGTLDDMPYQRRILLGNLLELTVDQTQDPGFASRIQADKQADQNAATNGGAAAGRPHNVKINTDSYDTQATALAR